jgi:hypothetical protein
VCLNPSRDSLTLIPAQAFMQPGERDFSLRSLESANRGDARRRRPARMAQEIPCERRENCSDCFVSNAPQGDAAEQLIRFRSSLHVHLRRQPNPLDKRWSDACPGPVDEVGLVARDEDVVGAHVEIQKRPARQH